MSWRDEMKSSITERKLPSKSTVPVANGDHIEAPLDAPVMPWARGLRTSLLRSSLSSRQRPAAKFGRQFVVCFSQLSADQYASARRTRGRSGRRARRVLDNARFVVRKSIALDAKDLPRYATALRLDARRLIVEAGAYAPRSREDFSQVVSELGLTVRRPFSSTASVMMGARGLVKLLAALRPAGAGQEKLWADPPRGS